MIFNGDWNCLQACLLRCTCWWAAGMAPTIAMCVGLWSSDQVSIYIYTLSGIIWLIFVRGLFCPIEREAPLQCCAYLPDINCFCRPLTCQLWYNVDQSCFQSFVCMSDSTPELWRHVDAVAVRVHPNATCMCLWGASFTPDCPGYSSFVWWLSSESNAVWQHARICCQASKSHITTVVGVGREVTTNKISKKRWFAANRCLPICTALSRKDVTLHMGESLRWRCTCVRCFLLCYVYL